MKMKKRLLSLILCGAMIVSLCPQIILADEPAEAAGYETGLCEHHSQHTEECGYTDGTEGEDCIHEHTEDCYRLVTECVHKHGASCYPEADVDDASPSEANRFEPTECTHECSEERGCIMEVLDCKHEHDEACGYIPATEGTPCTYVCEICRHEDDGESGSESEDTEPETDDKTATKSDAAISAIANVQKLINALPDVETLVAMSLEEQQKVYEQLLDAYDAYEALTDEQKSEIIGAETFESLFAAFNGMINTLEDAGDFEVTVNEGNTAAQPYTYTSGDQTLTTGCITVSDGADITISNKNFEASTTDRIVVAEGAVATVTLSGVNIQSETDFYTYPAVDVQNGANLTIILQNENTLVGGTSTGGIAVSGIHVPSSAMLTIQGDGTLKVTGGFSQLNNGGAGIGGNASPGWGTSLLRLAEQL